MIDFHTHILPNLDDGARDLEEAHNLILEAKKAGFDEIVFTPHYIEGYYETSVKEREVWYETFLEKFNGLKEVKTYLGSEILLSDNIMKLLENAKASTINNTSYILFELPKDKEPVHLYDNIYELMKNKVVPILSHPELCPYVQKEPEILYELVEKGVLIQADYGSIIGKNGKRAKLIMDKMLESNLVHFLGTNTHQDNTIYRAMAGIIELLSAKIGEEKMYELTTKNPNLALNNKKISIREPIRIKLTYKEKLMMMIARFEKIAK